jgi:hypothetical protein
VNIAESSIRTAYDFRFIQTSSVLGYIDSLDQTTCDAPDGSCPFPDTEGRACRKGDERLLRSLVG